MTGPGGRHRRQPRHVEGARRVEGPHRAGGPRHAAAPLAPAARRAVGTGHRASPLPRLLGTAAVSSLVLGCAVSGSAVAPVPAGALLGSATGTWAQAPGSVPGSTSAPVVEPVVEAVAGPVAVSIPAIGVQSSLVPLGLAADGSLEVPASAAQAGWFTGGAVPGARGPAVIAGHVDSVRGPGVFSSLDRLVAGDEVLVARADGSSARFVVTGSVRVPKDSFPADRVYGPVPGAELRLITCGGAFDRGVGHYEDNVVVFAVLAPGVPTA